MFHGVKIACNRRVHLTRELERIRHDSMDAQTMLSSPKSLWAMNWVNSAAMHRKDVRVRRLTLRLLASTTQHIIIMIHLLNNINIVMQHNMMVDLCRLPAEEERIACNE